MVTIVAVLLGAAAVCMIGPTWLARLEKLRISPAAVLSCWWSAITGVIASTVLGMVVLALPDHGGASPLGRAADLCLSALRHPSHPRLEESSAVFVAVLLGVFGIRAVHLGGRTWIRRRRHQRTQVGLLNLVGRAEAGILWLPHAAPLAFSMSGREPVIVATSGLRTALPPDVVAAVLAHERAHLCGHHHVQVALADALAAAAPCVPLFRGAPAAVRRLVEFAADEAAARRHGPRAITQAVALIAAHAIPPGSLAMSGGSPTDRLHRLAERDRPAGVMPRLVAPILSVGTAALLPAAIGGVLMAAVALLSCP